MTEKSIKSRFKAYTRCWQGRGQREGGDSKGGGGFTQKIFAAIRAMRLTQKEAFCTYLQAAATRQALVFS